ncbi:uncharacterized protein [Montipora foliosa]|uniref:uncharacterized protein isoform X2 n=1 Tax=Montipora foliosa TaxID=591990 RepID=UPI0035F14F0C
MVAPQNRQENLSICLLHTLIHEMKHEGATATYCMKHEEEIADFVDVPDDLMRHVIGTGGNTLRSIQERSGAKMLSLSRAEEGFWVSGTKEQREYAKRLILEMVEGRKFDQNKSDKLCYFIDDLNLPVNTMLRLEKYYEPPLVYRLRPFHSYKTEESPSLANDPIYFKTLEAEVLHSLQRIKREIGTKRPLKANIWCQFGTVLIRQGDEGPGGEWSIENALRELVEGSEWKTLFRGGVNLDEKFVEQRLCNQSLPEYEDYQSIYELPFPTPNGGRLTFKVRPEAHYRDYEQKSTRKSYQKQQKTYGLRDAYEWWMISKRLIENLA